MPEPTKPASLPDPGADLERIAGASRSMLGAVPDGRRGNLSGVVDAVLADRIQAARQSMRAGSAALGLSTVLDAGALAVWSDVLETLSDEGLSPVVYCCRTGRALDTVQPEPFADYLAALAAWGESQRADAARARLVGAVLSRKAYATAPHVLYSTGAALVDLREIAPHDFALRLLSEKVFPMPRRADSWALAKRAENLGRARTALASVPAASVAWLCECLSLVLAYADLGRYRASVLAVYGEAESVDFAAMLSNAARVGHLAGRLLQHFVSLLSSVTLRDVSRLSPDDLRKLRLSWDNVPEIAQMRARRRELKRQEKAARPERYHLTARQETLAASSIGQELLDTIDLGLILQSMGRRVSVGITQAAEIGAATARKAELKRISETRAALLESEAETGQGGEGGEASGPAELDLFNFDLGELLASGAAAIVSDDDGPSVFDDFALDLQAALAGSDLESEAGPDAFDLDQESVADFLAKGSRATIRKPSKPAARRVRGVADQQVNALLDALCDDLGKPGRPAVQAAQAAQAAKPLPRLPMLRKPQAGPVPVQPAPVQPAKPQAGLLVPRPRAR